jgi:hypothetical protein
MLVAEKQKRNRAGVNIGPRQAVGDVIVNFQQGKVSFYNELRTLMTTQTEVAPLYATTVFLIQEEEYTTINGNTVEVEDTYLPVLVLVSKQQLESSQFNSLVSKVSKTDIPSITDLSLVCGTKNSFLSLFEPTSVVKQAVVTDERGVAMRNPDGTLMCEEVDAYKSLVFNMGEEIRLEGATQAFVLNQADFELEPTADKVRNNPIRKPKATLVEV